MLGRGNSGDGGGIPGTRTDIDTYVAAGCGVDRWRRRLLKTVGHDRMAIQERAKASSEEPCATATLLLPGRPFEGRLPPAGPSPWTHASFPRNQ